MAAAVETRPIVALTMGDVAGVGPEVIARGWSDARLHALCRPLVIGDEETLWKAERLVHGAFRVQRIARPAEAAPAPDVIPCLVPESIRNDGSPADVPPGQVDRRAGAAAFAFLREAIDLALTRQVDAVTTLPLNKESLRLAGVPHPGHTEILAERCAAPDHAMMLYLATEDPAAHRPGLGVVHVTLHVSLRRVFDLLTEDAVASKIRLADRALRPLSRGRRPRVAVAALNPHAGENGLFGDEEIRIIRPAVAQAQAEGLDVHGPFPNDTLFHEALRGAYDAVVAMYHDQGHIALKTVGFRRAVNVTLGLPIVRTSVAHGTAFDIAWRGVADPSPLIEAVRLAARIIAGKQVTH
jgi:4-hydroxythreonine-4-phosphate dehydrogenase